MPKRKASEAPFTHNSGRSQAAHDVDYADTVAGGTFVGQSAELARVVLNRAKRLMDTLVAQVCNGECDDPPPSAFVEVLDTVMLAQRIDPGNREAKQELRRVQEVCDEVLKVNRPEPNHGFPLDVVIVGAGSAGVGMAHMLINTFHLDSERVLLLERGDAPGESFRRWPEEMRFISPSFNQQGWTSSFDLNAVAYGTSPAYTLGQEHPTGKEYASYLCALLYWELGEG